MPDRAPCDLIRFTWRSQARCRHWPFRCCSTPDTKTTAMLAQVAPNDTTCGPVYASANLVLYGQTLSPTRFPK